MNADALKIRNTLHQRKPLLEPWRFRDNYRIRAFRYRRMTRYLAGFLTRYPTVPSILLFRFQFDTQKISPRRLQGITEVMLLVQLRLIEAVLKDTLVAYFYPRTPGTLHILIAQDIKMTYRISLLLCYSFYYYFHNSNSIKILIFLPLYHPCGYVAFQN